MEKRLIVGLIAIAAIVVVAIFAGCIEEETPALDIIKIDVTSTTWREGEKPYAIYNAIEEKLKRVRFKVVPEENGAYNATLFVNYREEKDGEYLGGGFGTDIKCNIQLVHKDRGLLFEKKISASTPIVASNLYRDAFQKFENKLYFKYIGEIVASRYGKGDEVSVLISTLINDKSSVTRADAAEALGEIGDKRAVEPLIDALRDADYTVQLHAAEALVKVGDKRAVEPLIVTLKVGDSSLRMLAAKALGEIGDAGAVEPLTAALKDDDVFVRNRAESALEKIRGF